MGGRRERRRLRRRLVDRGELLDRLDPVAYQPAPGDERLLNQGSLARVLLNLVEVDQEREYLLCRSVAEHLLGKAPEPDDIEI